MMIGLMGTAAVAVGFLVSPVRREQGYDALCEQLGSYAVYQEPAPRIEVREANPWAGLNGLVSSESEEHKSEAVGKVFELRRLSGLPIKQLAELVGVSSKTIHNWQNGAAISAAKLVRVGRVLDVLRFADRGEASLNKAMLLTEGAGNGVLFDLLKNERFSEFRDLAGQGPGRVDSKKFSMVSKPLETAGEHLAAVADADHALELNEVRNFKKGSFDLTDSDWT